MATCHCLPALDRQPQPSEATRCNESLSHWLDGGIRTLSNKYAVRPARRARDFNHSKGMYDTVRFEQLNTLVVMAQEIKQPARRAASVGRSEHFACDQRCHGALLAQN